MLEMVSDIVGNEGTDMSWLCTPLRKSQAITWHNFQGPSSPWKAVLRLLGPEDEGTVLLGSNGTSLLVDVVQHPRRLWNFVNTTWESEASHSSLLILWQESIKTWCIRKTHLMTTLVSKQLLYSLIIRIFITKSFREVLYDVFPQHSGYQWLGHL